MKYYDFDEQTKDEANINKEDAAGISKKDLKLLVHFVIDKGKKPDAIMLLNEYGRLRITGIRKCDYEEIAVRLLSMLSEEEKLEYVDDCGRT